MLAIMLLRVRAQKETRPGPRTSCRAFLFRVQYTLHGRFSACNLRAPPISRLSFLVTVVLAIGLTSESLYAGQTLGEVEYRWRCRRSVPRRPNSPGPEVQSCCVRTSTRR